MPYTPPSHPSPTSSASASPDVSRRSSVQSAPRPALPRSASYLGKHRRTPSISDIDDASSASPAATAAETERNTAANLAGASVRQSPHPPPDDESPMPRGAIVSPPESASSASDDDDDDDDDDGDDDAAPENRARRLESLDDLRHAVSQLPQPRTPSPPPSCPDTPDTMRVSFSTGALDGLDGLVKGPRKTGHVRSATEPAAAVVLSADGSVVALSDDETDEDLKFKPPMLRKKSGELVRPALRVTPRRSSSVPGTPIFSKAVHFDSHLEHVRHFLQVDRPLAVSAGSSPVDNYESDGEYPFPSEAKPGLRSPPYEWELLATNLPRDAPARRTLPVRLERVWLSADHRSLLGSVAVANLAFQKHVSCRFTLDYWKTVSEVGAEYSHEIRPRDGHDRFTFAIRLSDVVNLESKTLYFCLRYVVNGHEFWDNNASANFQVDFRKKHLPQKGKNGVPGAASRPLNGLPRSNRKGALRPVSMPASLDAFGHEANGARINFGQPLHDFLGEPGPAGLRLKAKSSTNLASDNIARDLTTPSGVAFSNRYDFGASLSAAMQAAKDSSARDRDALYMRRNIRGLDASAPAEPAADSPATVTGSCSPSGTQSPNPTLPSSSYEELVNKYCFFGSKQSSPTMNDGTLKGGSFDGSKGGCEAADGAAGPLAEKHTALHHSIHLDDTASYFPSFRAASASAPASLHGQPCHAPSRTRPMTVPQTRTLASGSGTPSSDGPFHAQQQALQDRYPWTTETQTATAILG